MSPDQQQHQGDDYFGFKNIPPSSFESDFEVVLDDGILQRRTISLSTVPGSYSSYLDHQRRYQEQYQQESNQHHNNRNHDESSPLLQKKKQQPIKQQSPISIESDEDEDSSGSSHHRHDHDETMNQKQPTIIARCYHRILQFKLTYPQKMVIKCSTAYMLGSLFTFVPFLNDWVGGPLVASHLAATVTVFFNPAKTVGGMVEAAGYGWLFTLCALVLCLASVSLNNILFAQGRYFLSYGLTLGIWIGISSFIIAYFKGRMNKPSTGTASALAFIIILSTLVREPSPDRIHLRYDPFFVIRQLFVLVAIGTIISVAVCLLLWPVTATKKLKSDINNSLLSIQVLLKLLTKTFLLDGDLPNFTANKQLEEAIKAHRSGFTALKQSLINAKREHPQSMQYYGDIVSSLQRLDRHIGGLRSSCGLQFEVMQSQQEQWNVTADDQRRKLENELRREKSQFEQQRQLEQHYGSVDHPHQRQEQQGKGTGSGDGTINDTNSNEDGSDGELEQFIKTVRQPMKSLAYTCKQTIIHLQSQFDTATSRYSNIIPPPSFGQLRQNLVAAMNLFEDSLHHALSRMYNRRNYSDLHMQLMKELPADNIFLVYFFVFSLLEFAKELIVLVDATANAVEDGHHRRFNDDVITLMKMKSNSSQRTSMTTIASTTGIATATAAATTKAAADNAFFTPNNHNTSNTLHTPQPSTQRHKFSVKLWRFFSWFRQHTIKFAVKNMLTAIAVSALAFIPQTQPYFYQYRMEWTLLTVMTLLTPTVGGTNVGAVLRVLATIAGCVLATLTYTLFPANPIVLTLLTWLYSIPAFWVILYHRHGRFGQVALLAYNLVVLFMYNHREDPLFIDVNVVELAWIRCITVSLGVVIGLIVTAYIWPYEARKALRQGLSDLLIRLSWFYKHLSTTHDAEEMLFHQTECQQALVKLRDLLVHAPSEPRLKGPFPTATYNSMLNSCQNILDKFLSLRIVVLKDVWPVQVHQQLLMVASSEFMEMTGNVLLYFYVLASALQLKTPLPPYLPPAERAMRRLQYGLELKSDECYMAYYAYIALLENIIRELTQLGKDMKDLFGSLIPEEQWTTYFDVV
ncbi:Fusaric acid resistance protein-like-domain-containing protein [Phascolomyces articulosus]|uniref:Fusaric acid resistance protein-like-domain-containing protein n=1 Tax=Phascolomyces articulosus TaxID=60185 RepID=A0AAD5JY00_9FUNG|nr:Fusaric acid resistance protein-like-domain-containing protein [Phascolomyces articulosus]